jgi:hypothetical protein
MTKKIIGNPNGRHGKRNNFSATTLVNSYGGKEKKSSRTHIQHRPNENEQVDYSEFIDEMEEWGKPDE